MTGRGRPAATAVRERETPQRTLALVGVYDLGKPSDTARLMTLLANWSRADRAAGETGVVKVYLRRVE